MSIRIETRAGGQAYPAIFCEHCRERIDQAAHGVAIWPQYLHNGRADSRARYTHRTCQGDYEHTTQPPAGRRWAHGDLETHLAMLCQNVGCNTVATK